MLSVSFTRQQFSKKLLPFAAAGDRYLNSDVTLNVQFFQRGFTAMGSGVPAMENFEEAMHQLHWVNEEMQRQLKTNINMLVKLKDLMKMSVEFGVGGEEHVGLVFVETVAVCRRIGKMETANMKSKMNVKELFDAFKDEFTPLSETSELMERIIDVLKSNVKVIEEVSPKIRHILEKVDKPASLLELGDQVLV